MMKKMTLLEQREIMVDILCFLDDVCNKNNLSYFLGYGTLLGAIRHDGFIPWDDDIDVFMPINDYKKVIEIINSSKNEYVFFDCNHHSKYPLSYGKISKKGTCTIENSYGFDGVDLGVNIDIFPLIPVNDLLFKKNKKNIDSCCRFYRRKALRPIKGDFFIKNIVKYMIHLTAFYKRFNLNARMISNSISSCFGNDYFVGIDEYSDFKLDINDFSEYIYHSFEGRKFRIPKNYNSILTSLYGDYMTPPPEKDRLSTHRCNSFFI